MQPKPIIPEAVHAFRDELIRVRRLLHRLPELGFEEKKTSSFVAGYLRDHCGDRLEFLKEHVAVTGVVALIKGFHPGPCIAIRADMDGLPVKEANSHDFVSEHEGRMHACGHDAHMAMLLVAARVICEQREQIHGSVKLVFQPAEEGLGGAREMVKERVLEDPHVDAIFGTHVWNYLKSGTVQVKMGNLMASSDRFKITVRGQGGHGAAPQGTNDAIVAGSTLVTQLHTIVSRNVAPLCPAVVTVGTFNSGYNCNVIADCAELTGTVRYFAPEAKDIITTRIQELCDGLNTAFGVQSTFEYRVGYPATVNRDETSVRAVRDAATTIVGEDNVGSSEVTMAAEDFAFYLLEREGCFFFIGSAPDSESNAQFPHHKPNFDINEDALSIGCSLWVNLVRARLHK